METKSPDLGSLLASMNLQLSRYMFKKVGSKRHEIRFVTPVHVPFRIPSRDEIFYDNLGNLANHDNALVRRSISFSDVGILCSSATLPSLREVTLRAEVRGETSIQFGPNHSLRSGFQGEEEKCGAGSTYCTRHDFAKRASHTDKESGLLVLEPGVVRYPFVGDGTGIYHEGLASRYEPTRGNEAVLSAEEKIHLETEFQQVAGMISVDVIMVLDSGELLAFHWDHDDEKFKDDFFNVGLT